MDIKYTVFTSLLAEAIRAVAPTDGVAIGRLEDKSTWRIDFKPEATASERTAAEAVVAAFDIVAEEQKLKAKEQAKEDKKASLLAAPNKNVSVQDLIDLGVL